MDSPADAAAIHAAASDLCRRHGRYGVLRVGNHRRTRHEDGSARPILGILERRAALDLFHAVSTSYRALDPDDHLGINHWSFDVFHGNGRRRLASRIDGALPP